MIGDRMEVTERKKGGREGGGNVGQGEGGRGEGKIE